MAKTKIITPPVIAEGNHFATRTRAGEFARLMRSLQDPDPILKKMGKNITALQELLTDSHLESVWSVRCAAASGSEWFMAPGDDSAGAKEPAEAFTEELKGIDIPRVIEEMMDAVAYGFSPLEVLWTARDGRWGIQDIVGKPPQWFEFNQENRLVFKTSGMNTEELPENRFIIVRHKPSYANPYGVKVFSKCFWPVTFKKNGFRWLTQYVEKYGSAFIVGEYPQNASEQFREELLSACDELRGSATAIKPEGAKIEIISVADKRGGSEVHSSYIQMANDEISKAVLHETLTTEIGEKGSYAAANTHNDVREEVAEADRKRISEAFNTLAGWYTLYNFGDKAPVPRFEYVEDEDLQEKRAKRDVDAYSIGWRPNKDYFVREYGFQEDEFEVAEAPSGGGFEGFKQPLNRGLNGGKEPVKQPETHFENCPCGCGDFTKKKKKKSFSEKLGALLFSTPEERQLEKDEQNMESFGDSILRQAQEETDHIVDTFIDAIGNVNSYDEAYKALASAYSNISFKRFAYLLAEARYAASQLGANAVKKGGRRA
jgi:phage gp29-like protein